MGTVYVHPEVQIQVYDSNTNKPVSEIQHINLGEGIPFRTLSYQHKEIGMKDHYFIVKIYYLQLDHKNKF